MLLREYLEQGGIEIMKPRPAIHRTISAQSAVKTEWILPYDNLRQIMMACDTFRVRDCICRKQQDLEGTRKCKFPLHVELKPAEERIEPPADFATWEHDRLVNRGLA
jgi:hypothetical protein